MNQWWRRNASTQKVLSQGGTAGAGKRPRASTLPPRDGPIVLPHVDVGLWVDEQPLQLLAGNLHARMTVVRLRGGRLFVHSSIAPENWLIAALGTVGSIVVVAAPNKTHHFFARRFCDAFAKTEFWSASGPPTKGPDLGFANVIGTSRPRATLGP